MLNTLKRNFVLPSVCVAKSGTHSVKFRGLTFFSFFEDFYNLEFKTAVKGPALEGCISESAAKQCSRQGDYFCVFFLFHLVLDTYT